MKMFLKCFLIFELAVSSCLAMSEQAIDVSVPRTKTAYQTTYDKIKNFCSKPNIAKVSKSIALSVVGLSILAIAYHYNLAFNEVLEKECRDAVRIRLAKVLPHAITDQASIALELGTQRCISKFYHFDYSFIDDMKIRIKSLLHDEYGTFQWGWQNGEPLPW